MHFTMDLGSALFIESCVFLYVPPVSDLFKRTYVTYNISLCMSKTMYAVAVNIINLKSMRYDRPKNADLR